MIDFFGGIGALLGFFVGFGDVYESATAAGTSAACKAATTTGTIGECVSGVVLAGLLPFTAWVAGFGFAGLLLGLVVTGGLRRRATR